MADILYLDDEPEQLLAAAQVVRARKRFAEFLPPDYEGAEEFASTANLWIFDFFNDDNQRLNPDLSGVGRNGLSVFQQLRLLFGDARPPAVVVSNHLEEAVGDFVDLDRRHIVAEKLGVEWVAPKTIQGGDILAELLTLADATERIRAATEELKVAAGGDYLPHLAQAVLSLPQNAGWSVAAMREVGNWRPPAWIEVAADQRTANLRAQRPIEPGLSPARAIIAWLLRQVLPYPSFLISDRHVAVRLGLSLACTREALGSTTSLAKALKRAAYRGALSTFSGQRWWSAGVDAVAWELPRETAARLNKLTALVAPVVLETLASVDPVVVSNSDLVETDEIAAASQCVRAADEHFPAHAPPAWVKIDDAKNDKALAARVKPEDQRTLDDAP